MHELKANAFLSYTIGILIFFIGVKLNSQFTLLRKYHIPEPVTGGLLAAFCILFIYQYTGVTVSFDLHTRDILLVYFFTCIGINARFSDLISGGKPLLILLALTLAFIIIQDVVGLTGAALVGADSAVGVMAGSASLIGGHGTAIAWAPDARNAGLDNALEIGIASATLGLVIASLIGGPIASLLIKRYRLCANLDEAPVVGIAFDDQASESIDHLNIMSVILVIHIAMIFGYILNESLTSFGFKLPLFVSCLLTAIVMSNVIPPIFPRMQWPARTVALALVSEFSLGLFLAMSLMSMQLWTIAELAGPLFVILAMQTFAAIAFIFFLVFPLMGGNYQAAVLSAGFGGFSMGATPTAIANMTAVTKTHGPAPTAFIILPLVAAFFVDIANAFVIRAALAW